MLDLKNAPSSFLVFSNERAGLARHSSPPSQAITVRRQLPLYNIRIARFISL